MNTKKTFGQIIIGIILAPGLTVVFTISLIEAFAAGEIPSRPTVEYNSSGIKDPFQSAITKKGQALPEQQGQKALPALTVQGVVWGAKFPQAIINNKVVKVGDIIEEAKIISIDKEGIELLFDGRRYTLISPAGGTAKKPNKEDYNEEIY